MIAMTVAEVANIVGGRIHNLPPEAHADQLWVQSVCVDSRNAEPGSMFVAIAGERVDGHDFAPECIRSGAVVILAARQLEQPCIVVGDPLLALGRLGAAVRRRLVHCTVIAITGSSGKTSTKDLLAQVLGTAGPTIAAEGSFNTEVGVPLTILRADLSTRYLVLEMGMRGVGHIDYLCELAQPQVGSIVNVGSAHLGLLGTQEAIAVAKGEILDRLPTNGFAVLNGDDPLVMAQVERTNATVISCGEGPACRVRATDIRLNRDAQATFTMTWGAESASVTLTYHGRHFVSNALIVTGIATAIGLPLETVVMALRAASPQSKWRMEVHQCDGGITVINDSYNANPESARAALETLSAMASGRRSWAVFGEMLELGDGAASSHATLGNQVSSLGIDELVCVGEGTRSMAESASAVLGDHARWVQTPQLALELLRGELMAGDVILLKASRSVGLESLASALIVNPLPGVTP